MRSRAAKSTVQSIACLLAGLLLLPACGAGTPAAPTQVPASLTPTVTETATAAPTQTPYVITATPQALETSIPEGGLLVLSLLEAGHYHLFAYSPEALPLTRLTADDWDDITPALNPTGDWLAFSSRRNGYWDLVPGRCLAGL
jgi:hypothetical protein